MALGELPPWLDVRPRDFLAATEAGERAGEAQNQLAEQKRAALTNEAQRAQQLADAREAQQADIGLQSQKLASGLLESAADRAMREREVMQQQRFNELKFQTGTDLDKAALGVRNAALNLQSQKEQLAETKMKQDSEQKAAIDEDASKFWADVATKMSPQELAQKHPLAMKRKDIQQYINQQAIQARTKAVQEQKQKTPQEKLEIDPNTGDVMSRTVTGPVGSYKSETGKPAQGGYKIGTTYKGGLIYLGGDPNDESSWKKKEETAPQDAGTAAAYAE